MPCSVESGTGPVGLPPVRSCSTWLEAEPVALPSATQHQPDHLWKTKGRRPLVKPITALDTAELRLLQESGPCKTVTLPPSWLEVCRAL